MSRDQRIDQSATSIQSLLNTNGATFLMTSHVRSERILRQSKMPSLAHLLQLISALAGCAFANMQVDLIVGNSEMAP